MVVGSESVFESGGVNLFTWDGVSFDEIDVIPRGSVRFVRFDITTGVDVVGVNVVVHFLAGTTSPEHFFTKIIAVLDVVGAAVAVALAYKIV
jgi:hypothetical protein